MIIAWATYTGDELPPQPPAWVKILQAARAWGKAPWEITGETGTLAKKKWIERECYTRPLEERGAEMRMVCQIQKSRL
jgi:hypothetical protein